MRLINQTEREMDQDQKRIDPRRTLAGVMSLLLLAGGVWLSFVEGESSRTFAAAAMMRVGLVVGLLWVAWPSLRRPAQWLPAGLAMLLVLALVVVAAQPRLIFVAIPVVGALISLGAVVRFFRGFRGPRSK